jgi:2',3'-cyclic-nucleotide 3'-phosphodiesterase
VGQQRALQQHEFGLPYQWNEGLQKGTLVSDPRPCPSQVAKKISQANSLPYLDPVVDMGGSSLWLVPPPHSDLYKTLQSLILTRLPPLLGPEANPAKFTPHVTLTADTVFPDSAPQAWLDGLELPKARLRVVIKELVVGDIFYRKVTMRCEKTKELRALAGSCRKKGTGEQEQMVEEWVEGTYWPHVSLV